MTLNTVKMTGNTTREYLSIALARLRFGLSVLEAVVVDVVVVVVSGVLGWITCSSLLSALTDTCSDVTFNNCQHKCQSIFHITHSGLNFSVNNHLKNIVSDACAVGQFRNYFSKV